MNEKKRQKKGRALVLADLAALDVAACAAEDPFPPSEPRKFAPLLLLGSGEVLLRVGAWLRLPFGFEACGNGRATEESFRTRVVLPRDLGAKLLAFERHCAHRLAQLPCCGELQWTPSVKQDRAGDPTVNVKVVLGGAFEPPTQFKLRSREGFATGEGATFYRTQVAARGHFRGGHARLVLRPRYYVLPDSCTAGLYFTATHVALWASESADAGGTLDVDAVFPSEDLMREPPPSLEDA